MEQDIDDNNNTHGWTSVFVQALIGWFSLGNRKRVGWVRGRTYELNKVQPFGLASLLALEFIPGGGSKPFVLSE